jgi:hypothetical protein
VSPGPVFSEERLEQLRSFPDIGRDDLIRYFTLTQADVAFVDPGVLGGIRAPFAYPQRSPLLVARYLGWKSAPADGGEMKELEQFLLDRAMEHDSPTLLFSLVTEFLMSVKTIRPGVSLLEKMITSAGV